MIFLLSFFIVGILSSNGGVGQSTGSTSPTSSSGDGSSSSSSSSTSTTGDTSSTTTTAAPSTPPKTDPPTTLKPDTTTQDPNIKLDADATDKLLNILSSSEGKIDGNSEYAEWISNVRAASKWGKDRVYDKIATAIRFEAYMDRRQELEHDIHERLDELDLHIPDQERDSRCSKFYQHQKRRLKKALSLSNEQKKTKLKENSIKCRYGDDNDDEYYDYQSDSIEDYYYDEDYYQ
ncbi:serine-repeat antigen protein-like [Drosophila madeirensis]|uniref:Serine-repeat antigen protein-like n=1 Tax=Drosophila madeirensis TaxID=30013 RepID=A0AAU9FCF7_DROMD